MSAKSLSLTSMVRTAAILPLLFTVLSFDLARAEAVHYVVHIEAASPRWENEISYLDRRVVRVIFLKDKNLPSIQTETVEGPVQVGDCHFSIPEAYLKTGCVEIWIKEKTRVPRLFYPEGKQDLSPDKISHFRYGDASTEIVNLRNDALRSGKSEGYQNALSRFKGLEFTPDYSISDILTADTKQIDSGKITLGSSALTAKYWQQTVFYSVHSLYAKAFNEKGPDDPDTNKLIDYMGALALQLSPAEKTRYVVEKANQLEHKYGDLLTADNKASFETEAAPLSAFIGHSKNDLFKGIAVAPATKEKITTFDPTQKTDPNQLVGFYSAVASIGRGRGFLPQ